MYINIYIISFVCTSFFPFYLSIFSSFSLFFFPLIPFIIFITFVLFFSGSLSVLHWTWVTELLVDFGEEVGDKHKVSFVFILPDKSRFVLVLRWHIYFSLSIVYLFIFLCDTSKLDLNNFWSDKVWDLPDSHLLMHIFV